MNATETSAVARAVRAFRRAGGMLRTSEALRAGIHPSTLDRMRDEGLLVRLARGLYRLAELEPLSRHDLVLFTRRRRGDRERGGVGAAAAAGPAVETEPAVPDRPSARRPGTVSPSPLGVVEGHACPGRTPSRVSGPAERRHDP
ncbi:MAG: type IV toxin-antitoxin system AbiEi family antitoxin domain-containing protein [Planctomycetota bacterium JB042]